MDKKKYYRDAVANPDFPAMERQILAFWKENNTFQRSVKERPAKKDNKNNEFIFYDGPPFANGLPHYGHLLTGFVKDIFARYQTMKGKRVERRFGWDCHGLPAEMGAEKELAISGRHQIMDYGIEKFNAACRNSVMKYAGEWEKYVDRQARWVDFHRDYKTMDIGYMESVLWAFKQLYDKGLVYRSMRVMPYSWACETPLSNFETRLDNAYREVKDKAVTVGFLLNTPPHGIKTACSQYRLLAWTTTPWTLPSNLALAVNSDLEYVAIEKEGTCYILASFAFPRYAQELGIEGDIPPTAPRFKGKALEGLGYTPLFPYFKGHVHAFRVLAADFVEAGEGTGIVHLAPGFGEDDQVVCEKQGISLVCPVDNAGKFTAEVSDYVGLHVFEANEPIIRALKEKKAWLKTEQYIHNYPHCWRTDTPLIYKAVPSWYVEVSKFKDRMVELNQQINWIPGHIRDGLFGKWLENARDWSISRNRFWGSPIPVWESDNPEYPRIDVYGSIEALEKDFGVKVKDLHRPFIDSLTRPNPDDPTGKSIMRRVEDVFDCWFESGSMPYAQVHYPFENKEWFETHFPADFIVEYVAQTRGWFYTLMVLSTALFDKPPFLNCICHGVVLDEKGQKLSKRLNNYADPMEVFDRFGADAMRWVMMSAPIMHGGELLIDKEGNMVRDAVRLVLKPVWNACHFFTLYANADGIQAHYTSKFAEDTHTMDRYILAKCQEAIKVTTHAMDHYNTPAACKAIENFFEVLNNWYIRRNKERFWKETQDKDKQAAYDTLYTVLHNMCRVIAPLLPLLTETVWQGLHTTTAEATSVHLAAFPTPDQFQVKADIAKDMDRVRDVCNATLSIRNAENLRVRLPLARLTIVAPYADALQPYADLIKDEVNVKEIFFSSAVTEFASHKLKIEFPVLGKRLPHKMKEIIALVKQGKWQQTPEEKNVEIGGEVLMPEECQLLLEPKAKKGAQALSTNDALVILDLQITEALEKEGIARDLVRLVQQSRKEADLHISDRIALAIETEHPKTLEAIKEFQAYITEQTLAISLSVGKMASVQHCFEQALEGKPVKIGFSVTA